MMSSQSLHTVIEPTFQSKMPLLEGTIAATGLSKPQSMSGLLGKQMLHCSGTYFPYDPRGKDGAGFTPPWSNSKASLLDGRSPMSHLSGMEGQKHIIYRQDSNSSEEGHSHSSSLHHVPVKQGFTLYTKTPRTSSPTAATSVGVRKQKAGSENSSPPSENSVYLAFPKPVYVHNPCCNELGCVIGQRYSMENGALGIPNTIYEHDWKQTDAHCADSPPIQRKTQDTLLQQRDLQFELSAAPRKRMTVEAYSPGRTRTFPPLTDPNYSSYPCTPTHMLFSSPSKQSQRLQTSPLGYTSLYPSHPTYEHMTSEVYQEHSPMSKYGQLTQHPMFYYPPTNVEVEKRTQCKQREDVPVILKHIISNPQEHYIVPHSLHGEIPAPLQSTEISPHYAMMRGLDYPCYAVPRFHLHASQIRAPLKRQHASSSIHSNRINVSPSNQYMEHPMAPATGLQKEKPKSSPHVDQSNTNSPLLHVDQTSPTRCVSQHGISPSPIQMNRFFHTLPSLPIDRPIFPPTGLNMDRIQDYSSWEDHLTCPKQPKSLSVSPASWLSPALHHSSGRIHTAVPNCTNVRKIIYSPAVTPQNKHNEPESSSGTAVPKQSLKRSFSHSFSPIKIKEEVMDLCEFGVIKKRPRVEMENVEEVSKTDSPPMPVIDNVFSLAPYQGYLQASGVLFPGRVPQRNVQSCEHGEVKTNPDSEAKRPNQDEQQSAVSLVSKKKQTDTPTVKPNVDIIEPKNIKVEKVDPSDTDNSAESPVPQTDCSNITIKKEPEEAGSSISRPVLVIKKCEPNELENKPSLADGNKTKSGEVTAQMNSSSQGDKRTQHKQVLTLQPTSISPPQPSEVKHNFKNIPLECLKLNNRIVCDTKHPSPAPDPERPPAQLITEFTPKLEVQTPVRKHFLELHHALCKLVSDLVLTSPEQELRTWLSQLELTEPTSPSTKVQKVSCLLGVKAREVWLNEEMKAALHKVLERLREYTAQERCPFPHVIRTRAVFLPMLVVKELLFPTVQGSFIDQVLQEHRVELRPTTLSEEKLLIQLHKRACSSRLRRLMSLKHLPDIYADMVNLLYHACVCKHLGLDMNDPADREKDEGCEETISCRTPVFSDITASQTSPSESHPQRHPMEKKSNFNRNGTKSRVKTSSRRMFLDNSLSDDEEGDETKTTKSGCLLDAFSEETWSGHQSEGTANRGSDCTVEEQESSFTPPSTSYENSWMCPLTWDKLSPFPSDAEPEEDSSLKPVRAKSPDRSKSCSGMILKLRRMFSKGLNRKKPRYQAISGSGTFADPSFSQTDDGEGGVGSERDRLRRTPKVTHRWQRTGSFSHTLRPLSSSSKIKNRSLMKIKYCPYLSVCHSAEHRRRWVLRSAVQRARRAMRFFPDLVGKRIRHLYEEDDKSEVWYRGEVLRIHEAHTNPLKTIFEVRYDSEPEWKYYLELLIDYKKGWLKIED